MSKPLLMVLVLVVAGLVGAVVPAVSAVTIEPVADAYTSELSPSTNFNNTRLSVDGGSNDRWTWLKFDLSSIPPDAIITYAALGLLANTVDEPELYTGAFHATDDSWTEGGIKWDNQPLPSTEPTDVVEPEKDVWNYWDVISDVQSDVVEGDRKSTWCLKYSGHDSHDKVRFRSKEYSSHHPYLSVLYVIGNVESSDAGGSQKDVFSQADDVYCFGTAKPNTNVHVYVVHNKDNWAPGDPLTDVSGGAETVLAGVEGSIPLTKIWDAPLNPGCYDIVVDIDQDGELDAGEPIDGRTNTGFKVTFACICGDVCVNASGWWRDGGDFNASGTPIQAAVGNANAGETVCVKDGTYNENVDVNKRLTIHSENGSANCIVNASDSTDDVFTVTADYVNITGFAVENATGSTMAGIYLYDADNCRVTENNVTANENGIRINTSTNNVIADNIVHHNFRFGMWIHNESDNNRVENNTVYNQTGCWNGLGIGIFENSEHNYVYNNTVHDNTIDNIELWWNACYNTVEKNRCYNSEYGILVASDTNHNRIVDNELYENDYGIGMGVINESWGFPSPINNSVYDNRIHDNTKDGIFLDRTDDNSIYDNNCSSNGQHGIYLNCSSNNTLLNNTVNDNDLDGIRMETNSSNNTLTGNTVNENHCGGVFLQESSNNTLANNTVNENNLDGIILDSSDNNTIFNNTANENVWNGIVLGSSHGNNISNNTASENHGDIGIGLEMAGNNSIKYNIASSNDGVGIGMRNSCCGNNISCNWVHHNNQSGFYLEGGSTGNNISFNNIMSNGVSANESWHYNLYNNQSDDVNAANNYWATDNSTIIAESIYDWQDDPSKGNVTFEPYLTDRSPCAPIPELPTVLLFAVGLLTLAGYTWLKRKD